MNTDNILYMAMCMYTRVARQDGSVPLVLVSFIIPVVSVGLFQKLLPSVSEQAVRWVWDAGAAELWRQQLRRWA